MSLHYRMFYDKPEFALKKVTYAGVVAFGVLGGGCAFIYTLVKLMG
jgi:hypothetical protein